MTNAISGDNLKIGVVIGVMLIIFMLAGAGRRLLTEEEAKEAAFRRIKAMQSSGEVEQGDIHVSSDAILDFYDGQPQGWRVGIGIISSSLPFVIFTLAAYAPAFIKKISLAKWWQTKDIPQDIRIVMPPDVIQLIRAKKQAEEKVDEAAK